MKLNYFKWFINRWFYNTLIFYGLYAADLDIKWDIKLIDFYFNEYYLILLESLFLILAIISLIFWLKKWMYQYNIRLEGIITSWEIIEEKMSFFYKNLYKYTIKFHDNNSNEIIFKENHKCLLDYKEQKQLNTESVEWLEWTKIFPKIDIMYDKFDSNKAIIK